MRHKHFRQVRLTPLISLISRFLLPRQGGMTGRLTRGLRL